MIPARPGCYAQWETGTMGAKGRPVKADADVVAWDDQGLPLVVGLHGLEPPPEGASGMWKLRQRRSPVVAAIPASPGWIVRYTQPGDPESPGPFDHPVVGWAVRESGDAEPITHDEEFGMGLAGDFFGLMAGVWELVHEP